MPAERGIVPSENRQPGFEVLEMRCKYPILIYRSIRHWTNSVHCSLTILITKPTTLSLKTNWHTWSRYMI